MKTKTELLIDYVDLSRDFDYPERIETLLEDDFVKNHHLYDESTFKRIALLLLINPNASAEEAVEIANTLIEK